MRKCFQLGLLLAGSSVVAAVPAVAQDEHASNGDAIAQVTSEILVTATKKKDVENVQSVPLAVTALGSATLEAMKLRDLQSLTYSVPGVSLDQVGTARGTANFSIRGLGINSSIPSIEPTVGTFVDGVYIGVNSGVVFDTFDIDSVEILRGPQGILFGRNTTGGAVLVNSGNPTKEWRFKLRGSADGPVDSGRGAMNMTMQGVLTGPISDSLGVKLAAYHNSDGGYFRNLYNGGNIGKAETTILRGGLAWHDGDLKLSAKGEYFDSHGDGAVTQNHGLFPRDGFKISIDNEGYYKVRSYFGTLRADYDLGSGAITNIFGYRHYRQRTDNDIDSTPAFLFHSKTGLAQEQWSDELRYNDRFGALDLTAGGYIFHQNVAYEEDRKIPPSSPLTFYGGGRQKHDVYGLFVAGDYDLTGALTLNTGIRWSQEDKNAAVTYVRPRTACSVIAQTCPTSGTNSLIPGENNGFTNKRSWQSWTPKLGLTFKPTRDLLAYGSWTRAFRSGGYNFRVTAPVAAFEALATARGTPSFDAEQVDTFELGAKLQSTDRKATLNLAAYRNTIRNMQREINLSSGSSGVSQSIFNTANARIWGGEIEARYTLSRSLVLLANAGYIDARYTKVLFDISGNGTVGPEDYALKLPRVPKWTWGVGLIHQLDLGGSGSLVSRVNFQHRDRYAYTDNNFGWVGKSDNLDANLTWNLPVKGFAISVYAKNLLDQVQFGGDTQIPFGGALSDGTNVPFDARPAAGTFSPISKGRQLGVEVAIDL